MQCNRLALATMHYSVTDGRTDGRTVRQTTVSFMPLRAVGLRTACRPLRSANKNLDV